VTGTATGTVLVLRALGLGDLLVSVPALRALRRGLPDSRIVLAAPAALGELLPLIGAVDELLPAGGLGELHSPDVPPELAVNLHGRGPKSTADLLRARPQRLLTHRHPDFAGTGGPDWHEDLHEVDRWCRLVEYGGFTADRSELDLEPPPGPGPAPGAVVVHPGAAYPARRWFPDRFAGVAAALAAAGRQVVVTGAGSESELAAGVAELAGLPESAMLAGRTGLRELASLVAGAALVICGDTGVGHLATAFGTPSVLLFGPTPPSRWGPPVRRSRHRVLWAGSVGDPHGDRIDPGLARLTEEDVLNECHELLEVLANG
jgi:ADP-heptose:LPS heptosyltransferase